jgi:hypothetical protein
MQIVPLLGAVTPARGCDDQAGFIGETQGNKNGDPTPICISNIRVLID